MLISIEGNIGSGKSTFCKYVKEYFSYYYNRPDNMNIYFVDEPVDDWSSIKDDSGNLIEHFYKEPQKYAFCFQMTAYISRLASIKKILRQAEPNDVIIMERSVFSDYNVFARMLYDNGDINEIEYQCYIMWFENFLEDIPEIFTVYLKTDYKICFERVNKRCRKGEGSISLDYLKKCETYHENWLKNKTDILKFDGNAEIIAHHNYLDILKHIITYKTRLNTEEFSNEIDKEKWNKRLFNKTLEECNKKLKIL